MYIFFLVMSLELCFIWYKYLLRKKGVLFVLGFVVVYIVWVLWVVFVVDIWVYLFLKKLDVFFIFVFFVVVFVVVLFIYFVGEWVVVCKWV